MVCVQESFRRFRSDVKEYFERYEMIPSMYKPERVNEVNKRDILKEYHFHKNNISKLCGWDSIREGNKRKYNQQLFDRAIDYLVVIVGIENENE